MKVWPVPDSYDKFLPQNGDPGAFWENRDDRFNCGIDIFAPVNSIVVAIEGGIIIDIGVFSESGENSFWLDSNYIIIKNDSKILYKYAILAKNNCKIGDRVEAGDGLGRLAKAIDEDKVNYEAPYFIREYISSNRLSMLHLEIYKAPVIEVKPYENGNYLGSKRPVSLINPIEYLTELNGRH